MNRYVVTVAITLLAAGGARAQDSLSATAAQRTAATRASWYSDRLPLAVGDLLTIVVDEQTEANEHVSQIATGNRSQKGDFGFTINTSSSNTNIAAGASTGMNSSSRDVGDATRAGDLSALLSVRITAIEPNGLLHVKGQKHVTVDARPQEVAVEGVVRPEDVDAGNFVHSSRLAEAVITYKGKKIAPRTGIAGKILSILWP